MSGCAAVMIIFAAGFLHTFATKYERNISDNKKSDPHAGIRIDVKQEYSPDQLQQHQTHQRLSNTNEGTLKQDRKGQQQCTQQKEKELKGHYVTPAEEGDKEERCKEHMELVFPVRV